MVVNTLSMALEVRLQRMLDTGSLNGRPLRARDRGVIGECIEALEHPFFYGGIAWQEASAESLPGRAGAGPTHTEHAFDKRGEPD